MRIAEREKEKWNNPVQLPNNPYTPENLIKRISNNSFLRYNSGANGDNTTKKVNEAPTVAPAAVESGSSEITSVSVEKIKRGFESPSLSPAPSPIPRSRSRTPDKMNEANSNGVAAVTSSMSSSSVPVASTTKDPDLEEFKLPSVRDLRLRFSAPAKSEEQPKLIKSPKRVTALAAPGVKDRESSSRSMSPEDMSDPTNVPFEFVDMPSPVEETPKSEPEVEKVADQPILEKSVENTSLASLEPEPEPEPEQVAISITETPEPPSTPPNARKEEISSDSVPQETEEKEEPQPLSSARALIEKLEKLNKAAEPQPLPPSAYSRQKSVESPKTAMEFFATQEIRKVTPLEPDEDLRKLRRSIVRDSRGRKGTSFNFDE
jgi:hypothetical protein